MLVVVLAEGVFFLLENYSEYEHINIGTGKDIEEYTIDGQTILKNINELLPGHKLTCLLYTSPSQRHS